MVTLDISDIGVLKEGLCYTEEEAREKYGPDEGNVFGDDVQVCGQKLPKRRALKFMKLSGAKVAQIFDKLSYEEKHALMVGSAVLPEAVMHSSLSEHWRGSGGSLCDGCRTEPRGVYQHRRLRHQLTSRAIRGLLVQVMIGLLCAEDASILRAKAVTQTRSSGHAIARTRTSGSHIPLHHEGSFIRKDCGSDSSSEVVRRQCLHYTSNRSFMSPANPPT